MKPKFVHCLFEQSGTFKNEFEKLGYNAFDYDILNEFGETDCVVDLFDEIDKAYKGEPSVFDTFEEDELIMAFFPCTRFEVQIIMGFRGTLYQFENWTDRQKLEYDLKLHEELHLLYDRITKLAIVCIDRNLPLIIENPYSDQHYLVRYWALNPALVDRDRTLRGDYFKKPTSYWFVNCKPMNNFIFEVCANNRVATDIENAHTIKNGHKRVVNRSMIHKDYANRFIREMIIDEVE